MKPGVGSGLSSVAQNLTVPRLFGAHSLVPRTSAGSYFYLFIVVFVLNLVAGVGKPINGFRFVRVSRSFVCFLHLSFDSLSQHDMKILGPQ